MNFVPRFAFIGVLCMSLVMVLATSGCTSSKNYDWAYRREQLLEIYPPGITTREDVHAKWSPTKPEFFYERPEGGWDALKPVQPGEREQWIVYLRSMIRSAEVRSGKTIYSVERFWGADPRGLLSIGLCRCWFYYDAEGKLVDTEWQYMSD